MKECFHNTMIH